MSAASPRTTGLRATALLLGLALLASTAASCAPRSATTSRPSATPSGAPTAATAVAAPSTPTTMTFATIGDYGTNDDHERQVANLIASWRPDFILALGDDYYAEAGGTGTSKYARSTGKYFSAWLKDVASPPRGTAAVNAFFPALGNHDYTAAKPAPQTYVRYFTLPGAGFANTSGNERYYDFVEGPIHFFVLNSNQVEPDGTSSSSRQAQWLRAQLTESTSKYNVVYFHHPPYASDNLHGSASWMRWPFAEWGADAVISGHSHVYERVVRNGIVYFVNGLGGAQRYGFGRPVAGSVVRYAAQRGAQKVTVTPDAIVFEFYNVEGKLVDRYRIAARR